MTQQNTMPDELWVYGKCQDFGIKGHTDEYLAHDSQKHGDGNNDTRYLRANAVEDEMAPVKSQIVKLNCKISDMEIILKRARDFCDEIACDDNHYREDAEEIITAIDKALGENK